MNEPSETFILDRSWPGVRLDAFLRQRYPVVSRGTIQRLITEGHIQVNGARVKPTHSPRAGETVTVSWPAPRTSEVRPEEIPLAILHEDDDLLVLNKAPGMVVHPATGHEDHTLVNALLHHCAGRLSGIGGVARPGIVHRLDKDTSGCLVVAKNDAAHLGLSEQFAGRSVRKIYHALLCGHPARTTGEIRAAIARHPTHRKRMAVTDGSQGREAWSSYRVLELLKESVLAEVTIHTGRTHQVRVHCHHLGYPVVGDDTYGARQNIKLRELAGVTAPRLMLHAQLLEFRHPTTGLMLQVTAPWPRDFEETLQALRPKPAAPRKSRTGR